MIVDGYVRVSRVGKRRGPRFISPAVQRDAITDWARSREVEIGELFEELDTPGAAVERPLLEQAIRRADLGVTRGLVVWKVDRFGRSLLDGLCQVERIRGVGGTFYAVYNGLDTSTDAGRLALGILLSVAEFQRDGFRAGWQLAIERAVSRGAYVQPRVPVGYVKTRSGRLRPDARVGPIITEVFARRAAGVTWASLAHWLEDEGVRTGAGGPLWTASNLSRTLSSRVYLGEVGSGLCVNTSAHPPLTDPATWYAVRRPRLKATYGTRPSLLVGLARCGGCGYQLRPIPCRASGSKRYFSYRCAKRHTSGECPAPASISAGKLEPFVLDAALTLLGRRRRRPATALLAAEEHAAEADAALGRYRDNDRVARSLGPEGFARGIEVRRQRLASANLVVADFRARGRVHDLPPVEEIRSALPTMTFDEKRDFVSRVIDVVFVQQGVGPAAERVIVCPAGTAPRGLPHRGSQGSRIVTITPRRGWLNPRSARSTEPTPPRS